MQRINFTIPGEPAGKARPKKAAKYHSKKCECRQGHLHDSRKEAARCNELHLLQRAGEISDLEAQKSYVLIPVQCETVSRISEKTGRKLKDKTVVVEKPCEYRADFTYKLKDGTEIVEDVKGLRTPDYIIKRKLMLYVHGIKISEV